MNWALGHAAVTARFAETDLAVILAHRAGAADGPSRSAGEAGSLAPVSYTHLTLPTIYSV